MKDIVNNYVKKFNRERRKCRRITALLIAFALIMTSAVSWQFHSTGIAMAGEIYSCGLTEHQHDESCYEKVLVCDLEETSAHTHTEACYETVETLICGLEESEGHTHTEDCYETEEVLICGLEDTEGVSETSEGHTHTEDCYEDVLVCELEEHTHTEECLTDETADTETDDVADEETESKDGKKVLIGSGDFLYEDENVTITIHAEGSLGVPASVDENAEAETEASVASAEEAEAEGTDEKETGTEEITVKETNTEAAVAEEAS
ncbi:MAG: hypothetical protein LUD73_02990 [Lachnospiraceae bacterium]|nr:hypothetical protein [Lachnospiraceae bacterium]